MNETEKRFVALVDQHTRGLPEYDRGVTATFALAAFKTGWRLATGDKSAPVAVQGSASQREAGHSV